jgi:hypothetical protein
MVVQLPPEQDLVVMDDFAAEPEPPVITWLARLKTRSAPVA